MRITEGYVSAVESLTRPYDGTYSRIDNRMLLVPGGRRPRRAHGARRRRTPNKTAAPSGRLLICDASECRAATSSRLQRRERALHLVLRVGADTTATSERKPVPGVETQPYRGEEQQPGERRRSRARRDNAEQRGDNASQARFAGVREPAILLTTGVVHAATASNWRPQPDALWLALRCAIARSCHRRQTAFTGVDYRPRDSTRSLRSEATESFCEPAPKAPFGTLKSADLQG